MEKKEKKSILSMLAKTGVKHRTFRAGFFMLAAACLIIIGLGVLYYGPQNVIRAADAGWTAFNNGIYYLNGKVGIGTSNPVQLLDIGQSDYAGPAYVRAQSAANRVAGFMWADAGTNIWALYKANDGSQNLQLNNKTTPIVTFKQSGNVGIGTTNPGRELHIYSDSGAQIKLEGTSNGAWEGVEYKNATYQGYSGMNDQNGHFFIDMGSNGEDLSIFQNGTVLLPGGAIVLGNGSAGNASAFVPLQFWNGANSSGARSYRLAYDNNRVTFQSTEDNGNFKANQLAIYPRTGNVSIGMAVNNDSVQERLYVSGKIKSSNVILSDAGFLTPGKIAIGVPNQDMTGINEQLYVGGTIKAAGNISSDNKILALGGFDCASDERLKKDIKPVQNALSKILQLSGVSFLWNWEKYSNMALSKDRQLGLIAQEVEKVAPELVSTGNDGYKVMNYDGLSALLVNAIKEQQQQIDQLITENRELRQLIEKSLLNNEKPD